MKRNTFLRSLFALPIVGKALIETKPVEVDDKPVRWVLGGHYAVKTNPKTITINGCTQYLESNPSFNIGDDVITVNGSDLSIALSKRRNSKFR